MRILRHFLWLFTSLLLLIVLGFSWYVLNEYFKSEMSFRRNLTFLNFEQSGYRLKESLARNYAIEAISGTRDLKFRQDPLAILDQTASAKPVLGTLPEGWPKSALMNSAFEVRNIDGKVYLLRSWESARSLQYGSQTISPGLYTLVWILPQEFLKEEEEIFSGRLWIMNLNGELVYSSRGPVSAEEWLKHPLVQKFVQSPLSRFQSYVEAEEKKGSYGFAMMIPDSNLVVFAEIPLSVWTSPILKTLGVAGAILFGGFIFLVIILRSFVMGLREQANRLAQELEDFATGYFIPPEIEGLQLYKELEPVRGAIRFTTRRVREIMTQLEKESHNVRR